MDPAQPGLQVVWFKRDLRSVDHEPLLHASRLGPVLPLVVVEPELWQQSDASARQWHFCRESLAELRAALAELGQPLVVRVGPVLSVLERARRRFGIACLWSHEETGNGWTYARDRQVAAWSRRHGIPWIERPQFGVVRRLAGRDGWARRWRERMAAPLLPAPAALLPLQGVDPGPLPSAADLGLAADPCPLRQAGGRSEGLALLESFLLGRSRTYRRGLSSPRTAPRSCSRLSPHLAWGTLSMREVVQRTQARRTALAAAAGGGGPARLASTPPPSPGVPPAQPPARTPAQTAADADAALWRRSLQAFEERLHWHCHFIQKLECEPELEFRELHPLTAGLRQSDRERLEALARGCTGVPFVDACMRSLIASGWINFRMRAMLQSFATCHLWLPWRDSGLMLARLFVDYEPGIHWSQCQMQAGTTGINTIRIYNPIKQGRDHDPHGLFLAHWLPELAPLPPPFRHEPWSLDRAGQERCGCVIGRDYPAPIVPVAEAGRLARERLWGQRRQADFGPLADAIQARHGSRRSGLRPPGRRRRSAPEGPEQQLQLDLG